MMKKHKKSIICCWIIFLIPLRLLSQFEASVPDLNRQEFLNPAYNTFKNFPSLNLYHRIQWYNSGLKSPRTSAVNLYSPVSIHKESFGLGASIISENIGLRDINTGYINISKGINLRKDAYVCLGIGVGVFSESYNKNEIIANPDVPIDVLDLEQYKPAATAGIVTMFLNYFVGISTNMIFKDGTDDYLGFSDFNFILGGIKPVSENSFLKIALSGKYYRQKQFIYNNNGNFTTGFVDPIFNLALNYTIKDKIGIGTSHKFFDSQTFMFYSNVGKWFRIAYIYELGFGDGLNQFDSHAISIMIDLKNYSDPLRARFRAKKVNYMKPLSEYLY